MKEPADQPFEKQWAVPLISPEELLALPGEKALELILESPRPVTLVQSLAEEDLFWLVREIGHEDALPVLALASNDQWQFLFDLELWTKDRLEIKSVNRWVDLLLKADPDRFLIWGLSKNIELIDLYLFKNIDLRIREEDESPSDFDDDYFSLDGLFYIRINHKKYDQTIGQLLERLAQHDLEKFHQVLLELAGVLPAEVEENIYRLRNVRLSEKGFLPFEEAMGIYQYLDPQTLLEKEPYLPKVTQEPQLHQSIPVSTSLLIQDQGLFYISLKRTKDARILERLQMEFAEMCNQISSADGLVVRDKESLVDIVRKACGYLSIGLEKVTGGDPNRAALLLEEYPLHHIFRVGYGTALKLLWKTQRWFKENWFVRQAFGLSFWEDDWKAMLECLLRKRPLYYTGFSEDAPCREFRSLEEITHCQKALDQIINLDELLSLLFAQTPVAHQVQAYHPVTYKNLLLTSWAIDHLGLQDKILSLSVEELKAFFGDLWGEEAGPHRVDTRMKQDLLDWLQMRSGQAIDDILGRTGKTFDRLLGELEKEYGSVSLEDVDPRYVRHFLVRP